MRPRIAVPLPHSSDSEYAQRAIPQYEHAVELAGGEPVRVPLDRTPADIMKIVEHCAGVLLPGSKADVEPAKYGAARSAHTAESDSRRDAVDELLLQDAYNMRKPILGICYGLQILNVYRSGTLVQHIPDFLSEDLRSKVNHEAGRKVPVAHEVAIEKDSLLSEILCGDARSRLSGGQKLGSGALVSEAGSLTIPVNSSHHQSAAKIGDALRIVASCPADGIIEAVEGTSPDHFVLAVQWHPERSVEEDPYSRAIFSALMRASEIRHAELGGKFEGVNQKS